MRKKRILSLILALIMLIIATACGGAAKSAADSTAKSGASAAESAIDSGSRSEKGSGKTNQKDKGSAAADSKKAEQPEASGGSAEGKGAETSSSAGGKGTEDTSSAGKSAGASEESRAGSAESASPVKEETEGSLDPDGSYTSKEDVALYLHLYGKLPSNFITKKEAKALGWQGGSLEPYAPGKCIGGDRFGNYEGILPKVKGRTYYECDIDTLGKKKRGAKRIIYSSDGQIYYTGDHYETFELLYGEE